MSVRKRTWNTAGGERTAWVCDYNANGKRRLRTFATKKKATAFRDSVGVEVRNGVHVADSDSITVKQAGEQWLKQAEADGLEISTTRQYRQHLKLHIEPLLGDTKLSRLTGPMVAKFEGDLAKAGTSRAMLRKTRTSLGSIIAEAMRSGQINRNVVREVRARRRDKTVREDKRPKMPSMKEARALLNTASGRWRPLLVVLLFTGCRISEARALTWGDVDFDNKVIHIRQRANLWGDIGKPKSEAAYREIPAAPMVINSLREWRLQCPQSELDLVFPSEAGTVLDHANIYRRDFVPAMRECDLVENGKPKFGIHGLRHFAASAFIAQGFSPKRVQALMGHADIGTTFNTYGKLFPTPDDDETAMEQLQARLVG